MDIFFKNKKNSMNRASNSFFSMVILAMVFAMVTMKCNITKTTGAPEPIIQDEIDVIDVIDVIDDNSLSSLSLSGNGSWDHTFEPKIVNYTYTVSNKVESITITPTANSENTKITINDKECRSSEESKPISLKEGINEITIRVTAENSDEKYTVMVKRLGPGVVKSDDNLLMSLVLSGNGSWDLTFKPKVLNYTYTVQNKVESITLTPTANFKNTKITINNKVCRSNEESKPISLKEGRNEITIRVTAENGDVRKYIVMVERLVPVVKSDDNLLSSLVLSGNGSWDHTFKPKVLNYTYTVQNKVESITITPTANSKKAKITINDKECRSDEESKPISLKEGKNDITIGVTAENGDVRKYTVMVERLNPIVDVELSSLTISGASLIPDFNPYILKYKAFVPETKVPLKVNAVARSANATIILTLDGNVVKNQQDINFSGSKSTLTAEVTAGNGSTKRVYTIVFTTILGLPKASVRGIEIVEKGNVQK